MATTPISLHSARLSSQVDVRAAWIPIVFAIVFVSCTSTTLLSGYHTQLIVNYVWHTVLGSWHSDAAGPFNWFGRKIGHFFGYGMIGLLFRKAWYTSIRAYLVSLRSHIMLFSAALGVLSTFALASLDEWHQTYLPQRRGSIYDALLDATGALLLNAVMFAYWQRRRAQLRASW